LFHIQQEAFDEAGKLVQEQYNKRVTRFLDEFEWYIEAFKNQRLKGVHTRVRFIACKQMDLV
jgi:hypothetical protein